MTTERYPAEGSGEPHRVQMWLASHSEVRTHLLDETQFNEYESGIGARQRFEQAGIISEPPDPLGDSSVAIRYDKSTPGPDGECVYWLTR